MTGGRVRVGCAGWSLSAKDKPFFPEPGTHLQRYARVFSTVEINSSFYRPHQPATYARWAASVPEDFRFTAKLPRAITHLLGLRNAEAPLERFLEEVTQLGTKLGVLLTQLPPRLAFDADEARSFLSLFRRRHAGRIAWEARHATWFTAEAEALLREFGVSAVFADPAVPGTAALLQKPDGHSPDFSYFRLHGSPRMYYSAYPPEFLEALAKKMSRGNRDAYCIFDNTAEGAAVPNARETLKILEGPSR